MVSDDPSFTASVSRDRGVIRIQIVIQGFRSLTGSDQILVS